MESRKTVLMILCAGQQRRHRHKKQILDTVGEWRVEWLERIALEHTHYHTSNSQPVWVWCVTEGPKASALWQPGGTGWEGEVNTEGTHIYLWLVHVDVHGKTITILQSKYPPLKINKLKKPHLGLYYKRKREREKDRISSELRQCWILLTKMSQYLQ